VRERDIRSETYACRPDLSLSQIRPETQAHRPDLSLSLVVGPGQCHGGADRFFLHDSAGHEGFFFFLEGKNGSYEKDPVL
jgi:hypothetical protein